MKPAPHHLTKYLHPDQRWVVVDSTGWTLPWDGRACQFQVDGRYDTCRAPSVAVDLTDNRLHPLRHPDQGKGFCAKHLGSHRWVEPDGRIRQWRALPERS